MPFCCQCGREVKPTDSFCAGCGTRQASATAAPTDYFGNITPRTAAILCYIPIVGWIAAIVVLAASRFRDNRDVRFHAFQGLYLFVIWLIVEWVLGPVFHIPRSVFHVGPPLAGMMKAALIGIGIYMMVTTSQERMVKLPLVGELAERSVSEQR
jgi:uncharacterized membrane protein